MGRNMPAIKKAQSSTQEIDEIMKTTNSTIASCFKNLLNKRESERLNNLLDRQREAFKIYNKKELNEINNQILAIVDKCIEKLEERHKRLKRNGKSKRSNGQSTF